MNKIIVTVGILTGLGLFMTYTGHGQDEKNGQSPWSMQQGDEPDSLSKKDLPAPPAPPSTPSPPTPPVPPTPPAPPTPPTGFIHRHYFESLFDQISLIQNDSLRIKKNEELNKKLAAEMKKMEEEIRKAELEIARVEKEIAKSNNKKRKAELEVEKAEKEMQKAEAEMSKAELEMVKAEAEIRKAGVATGRYNNLHEQVLEALKAKFGKIDSYEFSNRELVVNGKKQPDVVHQEFANKYIGKQKVSIQYSSKGGRQSVSTSIESED